MILFIDFMVIIVFREVGRCLERDRVVGVVIGRGCGGCVGDE